jgi:hypothetical protein
MLAGSVCVEAQTAPSATTLSDPLQDYTLDVLYPVRSAEDVEAMKQVAARWQEMGRTRQANVDSARDLVNARLDAKKAEIEALKERVKVAKSGGDDAPEAQLKAELKLQQIQVDALVEIVSVAKAHDELGKAQVRAGEAWERYLDAELRLRDRFDSMAERAKAAGPDAPLPVPTADDFEVLQDGLKAFGDFGDAMEAYGTALKDIEKYSTRVADILEKRTLGK